MLNLSLSPFKSHNLAWVMASKKNTKKAKTKKSVKSKTEVIDWTGRRVRTLSSRGLGPLTFRKISVRSFANCKPSKPDRQP